ncbi:MAG: hypothetical protein GKS03_03030 [Alphaproteobacteria bacterium]|nr:hypothetical protein [Alphaproteobacteria bacterium]
MPRLKSLFCEHPESVNESYLEHLMFAVGFGFRMLIGGLACVVHGLLPFLFERTGSKCVCDLHERLSESGRPARDSRVERVRVA